MKESGRRVSGDLGFWASSGAAWGSLVATVWSKNWTGWCLGGDQGPILSESGWFDPDPKCHETIATAGFSKMCEAAFGPQGHRTATREKRRPGNGVGMSGGAREKTRCWRPGDTQMEPQVGHVEQRAVGLRCARCAAAISCRLVPRVLEPAEGAESAQFFLFPAARCRC